LHWLLVIPDPLSLHRRLRPAREQPKNRSIALGNILKFLLSSIPPV